MLQARLWRTGPTVAWDWCFNRKQLAGCDGIGANRHGLRYHLSGGRADYHRVRLQPWVAPAPSAPQAPRRTPVEPAEAVQVRRQQSAAESRDFLIRGATPAQREISAPAPPSPQEQQQGSPECWCEALALAAPHFAAPWRL
eukprot:gene17031-2839_t